MRDYRQETEERVAFIREVVASARAGGIVFGNSGGKDCALVGILCKMACEDTLGLIMPCGSKRNYEADKTDAEAVAGQYAIATRVVDLSAVKAELCRSAGDATTLTDAALANIAPRLRMTALYAVAASENRLVAGTGNRSERYMGYFTKWGDGACDFNPIADLTVGEVYDFLRHLGAPACVLDKAPSAGLFDGQTDEGDMGVTYRAIDDFLLRGIASPADRAIIDRYHAVSEHKRILPPTPIFE
ncbi:MAG: NAD(+) synthase [Kiritimatiellaeota bacterium]|nr:NAD(+) synthase [Kiritimatiellota bacterium]